MTGEGQGFRFAGGGDAQKLMDIVQWGFVNDTNGQDYYGCTNLKGTFADSLDNISTGFYAFYNSSFNGYLNDSNVSNSTTFERCFTSNNNFNQPLNKWRFNTSSTIDFTNFFWSANSFNQNIGAWNVEKVTDMDRMFLNASK